MTNKEWAGLAPGDHITHLMPNGKCPPRFIIQQKRRDPIPMHGSMRMSYHYLISLSDITVAAGTAWASEGWSSLEEHP